jgi:hypothetical protein
VFAKKWLGYTLGEFFSPTHQVTLLRFFWFASLRFSLRSLFSLRSSETQGLYFQGGKQDEGKANPFVIGPYGNSAFNPQRLGAKPMVSSWFLWRPRPGADPYDHELQRQRCKNVQRNL